MNASPMRLIRFSNGLVLRNGARILDFKRELDNGLVQLEYQDNCQVITYPKGQILKKIQKGELSVVVSDGRHAAEQMASKDAFVDLTSLTQREQIEFERRIAYVLSIRKRGIKKGQRHRIREAIEKIAADIGDQNPPRSSAVMEWLRKYERADDNAYVLVSRRRLIPHGSKISGSAESVVLDKLAKLYLNSDRRTGKEVWQSVHDELGRMEKRGVLPEEDGKRHAISLRTFYRRIGRIDPFERDRKREGEARARNKWRHSLNTEVCIHPMQRVEVDHTKLDLYVVDDRLGILLGRPWLTVLVDRYSGYILGFYVSFAGPSIQSALGAVKASIFPKQEIVAAVTGIEHHWLAEGIAWQYVFDNGLEFQSRQFRNVIQFNLRSELQFCAVRQPWLKPAVERTVGLFNQHALPRQGRVHGKESWADFNPTKHAAISFSDLCQILMRWVVDIHPFGVNERKIARPYDLFAEGIASVPIPEFCPDPSHMNFVAAIKRECTVNREGVGFKRLQYNNLELSDMMRSTATSFTSYMKYDPEDVGRIYVQNPKTESWIEVPCTRPDYANALSLKQHEMIRAFRRKKLNEKHDVDGYVAALVKFQEYIMSRVGGRVKTSTSANMAKFSDLTSAKVFAGNPQSILDSKGAQIVAKDEFAPMAHDVPDFEVSYVS